MKNELLKQKSDAVLRALNNIIDGAAWDESSFLKVMGKKLRSIRDEFASQVNAVGLETSTATSQLAKQIALRSGQREIFILLYSSDGSNLQSWERILVNLPRQIISRPIYANEEDAKAIIKTKENKVNEAYVSMYVREEDILSVATDKLPIDKLGKPMLSLKDRSLSLDNLNYFAHQSTRYRYTHGRLVSGLIGDVE